MHVERAARRRHAQVAVTQRAVDGAALWRRAAVGIEHGDEPEDAEVLEPCRALDERTQIEAVIAWRERRLDRELEPRDLTGTDVRGRLHRDAVVARPTRRERARGAITAEWTDLILSRLWTPRPEIRGLAEAAAHPSEGSAVEERDGGGRSSARAQRRVPALSVPPGVKTWGT